MKSENLRLNIDRSISKVPERILLAILRQILIPLIIDHLLRKAINESNLFVQVQISSHLTKRIKIYNE